MLPKLNGIKLCQQLRRIGNRIHSFLTALDNSTDKVMGLDAGAMIMLLSHLICKAASSDSGFAAPRKFDLPPVLESGLRLDPSTCEVTYENRLLHLTQRIFFIRAFLRNSRRVLPKRNCRKPLVV